MLTVGLYRVVQDNIRGKHGGEMASAVYKLVYHGSKIWRSVALSVLNQTAKPIIAMIRAWMLEVRTAGQRACASVHSSL